MYGYKTLASLVIAGCLGAAVTGCSDKLAEINESPSTLTTATPTQLLLSAELQLQPFGYGTWFFNAKNYIYNNQMGVPSGSVTAEGLMAYASGTGTESAKQQRYFYELQNELSAMSESDAASYAAYSEAIRVLAIYMGIFDTDVMGEIPYIEAAQAKFGGPTLPKYDTVEELYNLWNEQLKNAVAVFVNPPTPAVAEDPSQDIIYGCDWSKWAKFANSLRVKLATRLLFQKPDMARQMVSEALSSPAGLITDPADDVLFHKADASYSGSAIQDAGDMAYGTGNTTIDYNGISAAEKVVDFMVKNGDPRVHLMFTKNQWSSKIVDYYLRNGHIDAIPRVVLEKVNYEADGSNYRFVSWKGKGEPWVRYIGLPDVMEGAQSVEKELTELFHYSNTPEGGGNLISANGANYSYRPYSRYNERLLNKRQNFTPAYTPDEQPTQDVDDNPRYDLYMSAGEVNLYLAEFAIYGGIEGLGDAAELFKRGVRTSVESWNNLVGLNKIQYYEGTYGDDNEATIALKDGEIESLLQQPDYQLTGNKEKDLEKVFLNLEFHFTYNPIEQFVTGRRSGVPKIGSELLPRTDYPNVPVTMFNRRSMTGEISPTDIMGDLTRESYKRQGFSTVATGAPGFLNTERLWQDKGAPQYGQGPLLPW